MQHIVVALLSPSALVRRSRAADASWGQCQSKI